MPKTCTKFLNLSTYYQNGFSYNHFQTTLCFILLFILKFFFSAKLAVKLKYKYMKLSSFFVMKELTDTSDRVSYKDVFFKKNVL